MVVRIRQIVPQPSDLSVSCKIPSQMIEQYVFLWNVPTFMKWRDLHGLIHTKVIRVEEMAVHERDSSKDESKVAILRVFSTTESSTLEKQITEMEMSNGEKISASVETSLYVFYISNYSTHIPNFIRQHLRDVNMTVDEAKEVIRCEFRTYGEFMRVLKSVEVMMATYVNMRLYRYVKGGNKLPPPSILSLKFNTIPLRYGGDSDSDLVSYEPPLKTEINIWVMEQDYNMWNALYSVKYPSIRQSCEYDNQLYQTGF